MRAIHTTKKDSWNSNFCKFLSDKMEFFSRIRKSYQQWDWRLLWWWTLRTGHGSYNTCMCNSSYLYNMSHRTIERLNFEKVSWLHPQDSNTLPHYSLISNSYFFFLLYKITDKQLHNVHRIEKLKGHQLFYRTKNVNWQVNVDHNNLHQNLKR